MKEKNSIRALASKSIAIAQKRLYPPTEITFAFDSTRRVFFFRQVIFVLKKKMIFFLKKKWLLLLNGSVGQHTSVKNKMKIFFF
jgi:hypothetical protein